jgi:hypothetical protein
MWLLLLACARLKHGARGARDTRPQVGALLRHGSADGGALHVALGVHDHARVVLEVDEHAAVHPPPRLALPHDHRRHHLLAQLGLSLLDGSHHHVADGGTGHLVKTALDALDGHDVQVLRASVVGAVHDGAHAQTEGRAELVAHGTGAATLGHDCG